MSAPDELDRRIRILEAERLRPLQERPLTDYQQLLRDAHDWVTRRYDKEPDNPQTVPNSHTGKGPLGRDMCTTSGTTDPQAEEGTVEAPDAVSDDEKEAC